MYVVEVYRNPYSMTTKSQYKDTEKTQVTGFTLQKGFPTQLYEAILLVVIAVVMYKISRTMKNHKAVNRSDDRDDTPTDRQIY